jgi:hypothetical protein
MKSQNQKELTAETQRRGEIKEGLRIFKLFSVKLVFQLDNHFQKLCVFASLR